MAALLNSDGEQLLDKNEQPLKAGATATHDFLGDCLLRGTVNVTVDWFGPGRGGLPPSVGAARMYTWLRWEKYGWQLGKITDIITRATPRLFKKFNFRIIWTDGSKGPASLSVDNYGSGTACALQLVGAPETRCCPAFGLDPAAMVLQQLPCGRVYVV